MPTSIHGQVEFDTLSGKGVRVAVIDTGIDPTHPRIRSVSGGVRLTACHDPAVTLDEQWTDDFGHGTACAAVIRRVARDCELLAVKISDGTRTISPHLLATGIDWAIDNRADVISISAGTTGTGELDKIVASCRRAYDAHCVVIAADGDTDVPTHPASLESVIAVGHNNVERGKYAYRCDPLDQRRFAAYGGHQRVAWLDPRYLILSGASFAAARLAGIMALIIGQHGRLARVQLLSVLRTNATNGADARIQASQGDATHSSQVSSARESLEWIRRSAMFPLSKELHSLVRFRHLLPFELVAVADPIGKGCVGQDAGTVIGVEPTGLVVTADVTNALEKADTLILGFSQLLGLKQRRNVQRELILQAIRKGKNVYCLEPLSLSEHAPVFREAGEKGVRVAWPSVTRDDLSTLTETASAPKSYAKTPILGVFGTSRSQGKFTMQLVLREKLQLRGLKVGQIGTEHQSQLFGMDDSFPLGHVNNVYLEIRDWSWYFDLRYQQIVRDRSPDILIFGSQGGLLPQVRSTTDGHYAALASMALLIAARCDSYILVVNHDDPLQLIQNAITTMEVIGGGKVILLTLSTLRRRLIKSFGRSLVTAQPVEPDEQANHLRRLQDHFQIPAVSVLDSGSEKMIEVVLQRYSGM